MQYGQQASFDRFWMLPHLPLVQWRYGYPIGAVKVWHEHLQNVLNLKRVKEKVKEKQLRKEYQWEHLIKWVPEAKGIRKRHWRRSLKDLGESKFQWDKWDLPAHNRLEGQDATLSPWRWIQKHPFWVFQEFSHKAKCFCAVVELPDFICPTTTRNIIMQLGAASYSVKILLFKHNWTRTFGEKKNNHKPLTFSGDCLPSLVGVSGLLPSLPLRFFLAPVVDPGLFFCWYSFN